MENQFKKKKKKSFLQKAKKYGKKGQFGRGHNIDASTYNYFVQVLANLDKKDVFEDEEAKEIFVANVFASNVEEEDKLCCNQLVSRVFEKLLPLAPHHVKLRLMKKMGEDLRIFVTNPFASHVLETLLILASFKQSTDQETDSSEKKEWTFKVAKYGLNNFNEFAQDQYANHVLRRILNCVAGTSLSDDIMKSKRSQAQNQSNLDLTKIQMEESVFAGMEADKENVDEILTLAYKKIEQHENIRELCQNDISSGFIQTLLLVLSKKYDSFKLCKKLAKLIANEIYGSEVDLSSVLENQPLCRLLETLLQVSGSDSTMAKIFNHFHENLFKGQLLKLSLHPTGNFCVQKYFQNIAKKETFEEVYEQELDAGLESIFKSGHYGVILSIGQACRRLSGKQAHFIVALMKCLRCYGQPDKEAKFISCLTKMRVCDADDEEDSKPGVNLQGALLVQELLQFNKPIKLVNSVLNTDADKIAKLLSDPRGCHITDAFMASNSIGEKSREGLVKLLTNQLPDLACSKHGSRTVDAIWNKASLKIKELLATKLVAKESKLASDHFGKFVSNNIGLGLFKRSREKWLSSFDQKQKAKELFSDFIKNEKTIEKTEEDGGFVIDKKGDHDNTKLKRACDESIEKSFSPKKKAKKSYLDDL